MSAGEKASAAIASASPISTPPSSAPVRLPEPADDHDDEGDQREIGRQKRLGVEQRRDQCAGSAGAGHADAGGHRIDAAHADADHLRADEVVGGGADRACRALEYFKNSIRRPIRPSAMRAACVRTLSSRSGPIA